MVDLADYLYVTALVLYALGGAGAILIWIRNPENNFTQSLGYKVYYLMLLLCLGLCWGCLDWLVMTMPRFKWLNALFSPPLLVVSAFHLVQLCQGWRGSLPSEEKEPKIFLAYWICMSALGLLIALLYIVRYAP